ncbi:XRE family transcriptional regulator [uncultured Anaerococcus sp.]|uniref:LexA family protein n=1 Tax=uncultured Anaerococcus sp. TaxID=293428 RepID=UPI00288BE53E|nr:XRE family transcriptional regulator [uncultured Anaerococcus sp.]
MTKLTENLKYYRKLNGYTQETIAPKLKITTSAYGMYEQGRNTPPYSKLKELSEIYNISISELTGEPRETAEFIAQAVSAHTYPYIDNYVSAGKPTTISGMKNLPQIQVPDELMGSYAGNNKLYFMKVNGESMNKIIPNDSIIGILEYESIHDLKNGDIVVYSTEDSEYAVKFFYRDGDKLIFRPSSTNPNYYDTIFNIEDNIKIMGKVVQYSVTL